MKCLVCERYSWKILCRDCLNNIPLTPRHRILANSIKTYSFYRYEDVALLMQSKYHLVGSRILATLAKNAAKYFFSHIYDSLESPKLTLLGLDDYPYGAYSHTGVIVRAFTKESKGVFEGCYGALKAQNNVKYAGESLQFRQDNPKGFALQKPLQDTHIVLIDDIITTGTSLNEAINVLHSYHIAFCLTLCDAR
ncbi:phosphoribosyltransferase [uncultured Helicobacter sp.]|uniref:ComF family protein n=1 Tax=uncultured Helicobacter sp. TaxID=175537 RepID=UPI00260B63D1|nr:phosphoribosyltransferase [uncultured Helicobacter sp.]